MATRTGHVGDHPSLPFQGSTLISRHCSYLGAKSASERVGRQCLALLAAYAAHGALTDQEAARAMSVERSTVNARRAEIVKLGLVVEAGHRLNEATGIINTLWDLTSKGVERFEEHQAEGKGLR